MRPASTTAHCCTRSPCAATARAGHKTAASLCSQRMTSDVDSQSKCSMCVHRHRGISRKCSKKSCEKPAILKDKLAFRGRDQSNISVVDSEPALCLCSVQTKKREGRWPATHNFPKLHNAMWPGLVGKGADSEPEIGLDVLIDLTAKAEVNGVKFDGIDIFHVVPHTNIDFTEDEVKALADKVRQKNLNIGSIVAPVWPPVGGGSAMGSSADRKKFVANVEKSCKLGKRLRDLGVRHYGVVRIRFCREPFRVGERPCRQYQNNRQDISRGLQRGV